MKIVRVTVTVTYDRIFRVEGDLRPCLAYSTYARRPDGKVKWFNGSVVLNPDDLACLQTEFEVGDRIKLTTETDWGDPDIPVTLIGIEKVNDPSDTESHRREHKCRYQARDFCSNYSATRLTEDKQSI